MPSVKQYDEIDGVAGVFHKLQKEIGDPVDFELPDWLIRWRPTAYKSIKRNIYLTKKTKKRQEDDGIYCSCRSTAESPGVCDRDCLCGMLQSSCSSGCKCGSSCANKPFHQRPVKKMKIVQTDNCGTGIIADEDIKKGDFIVEYVGEVIDDKTCEERLWKMKHCGETNFYLCEINRDTVIDATFKGNKSRYINHSCYPNAEMQKWRIDGETRIGICATRDIIKGEYLTYDYQFVQFGADQDCHCGAVGCRRKLGVKPTKLKTSASDAALKIVACQVAMASPRAKDLLHSKEMEFRYKQQCLRESKYYLRLLDALANKVAMGGETAEVSVTEISSSGVRCNTAVTMSSLNCIGEIVMITRPHNRRLFGAIKQFDNVTKKHLIMFEDGTLDVLDMSQEDWELL